MMRTQTDDGSIDLNLDKLWSSGRPQTLFEGCSSTSFDRLQIIRSLIRASLTHCKEWVLIVHARNKQSRDLHAYRRSK